MGGNPVGGNSSLAINRSEPQADDGGDRLGGHEQIGLGGAHPQSPIGAARCEKRRLARQRQIAVTGTEARSGNPAAPGGIGDNLRVQRFGRPLYER